MRSAFLESLIKSMLDFAKNTGKYPAYIFLGDEDYSAFAAWVQVEYGEALGDMVAGGWEPQVLDARVYHVDTVSGCICAI